MKTDRELLEMAAKAFWSGDEVSIRFDEYEGGLLYIHADNQDHNGADCELLWNPRDDDGDALRLAVKLSLDFYQGDDDGPAAYAGYFLPGETRQKFAIVQHVADPYAATRRAIVRAAAAIGEGMADPTAQPPA